MIIVHKGLVSWNYIFVVERNINTPSVTCDKQNSHFIIDQIYQIFNEFKK
jgi:hypothetical protein